MGGSRSWSGAKAICARRSAARKGSYGAGTAATARPRPPSGCRRSSPGCGGTSSSTPRARLASILLQQEIERYRAENQDPLLARAGQLFADLTIARYSGLRTDFDDREQPILVGLRADGRRVPVEALSDGTRDQLYPRATPRHPGALPRARRASPFHRRRHPHQLRRRAHGRDPQSSVRAVEEDPGHPLHTSRPTQGNGRRHEE